jgi:hypothetical protein
MFPQDLLLAKSGCPDLEKRLAGLPYRQLQSSGGTLGKYQSDPDFQKHIGSLQQI